MAAFTALNGGSPKATADATANGGLVEGNRAGSAERTNGSAPPADQQSRDQQQQPPPPSEASPTQGEREGWTAASHGSDRPSFSSASYQEAEHSHKRKRSDESMDDLRREAPAHSERQVEEAHPDRSRLSEPRDKDLYEREGRKPEHRPYADVHRERWYSPHEDREDRHPYSQPASAVPDSAQSDEQMEALRRATEDYPQTSPDGEDRSIGYSGQYTPEHRRDGVISDPKKRKRNFSNRTKTGCLTCRKRKKKCDEAKPECSNCLKGGFVCAGYPPQRGAWQKPENKVQTVQIESKDPSYKPPGAYGMPQQAPTPFSNPQPPLTQQKREPLPSYRGPSLRIEPPQGRPIFTDDDRPTASTLPSASVTSPDNNKLSALTSAYTNTSANVFPTPVSAAPIPFPERAGPPKEYSRVPPLHDLTRTEPDMTPQSTTLPHINIIRTNSPLSATPQSTTAQTTAQLALSHTSQFPSPGSNVAAAGPSGSSSSLGNTGRREKDEMLAGRSFYPFEKELVLERERCNAAVWRFNNSMNPNMGVSPSERARLFREIIQPRGDSLQQRSPTHNSPVTTAGQQPAGRVGDNVVVEAPFTCDYGYNIKIGKNSVIGRNCTMVDACEISIGNNVVIGPNVSFYTTTMPTDPLRRQGARGPCSGKPIVIEDDVFIGGSVTILGGVRIGRGTTVGAGSLVTKSQPPHCICVGSPAKVTRGVASAYSYGGGEMQ